MITKGLFEKIAAIVSVSIIAGWLVFWVVQAIGVWDMLTMAYG
jgi:hypothetical protein